MQGFVESLGLKRFAMCVFEYGAHWLQPGRIRTEAHHRNRMAERNAYEEGLSDAPWAPLRAYWKQPSQAIRDSIKQRMSLQGVRSPYFHAVPGPWVNEPESY